MTGRMASFTERRSCQISWQHAPLSRYIVQSLPLLNFFKRKPSQCRGSQYNGLLLLSPWDEQYQINFAKSIRIIFQRCVRCHRQRIFYSGAFDMALYPRLYPPRVPSSRCWKPFLISQRFSDCWAADMMAPINKLKVSLLRGTGSIYCRV